MPFAEPKAALLSKEALATIRLPKTVCDKLHNKQLTVYTWQGMRKLEIVDMLAAYSFNKEEATGMIAKIDTFIRNIWGKCKHDVNGECHHECTVCTHTSTVMFTECWMCAVHVQEVKVCYIRS